MMGFDEFEVNCLFELGWVFCFVGVLFGGFFGFVFGFGVVVVFVDLGIVWFVVVVV